MHCHEKTLKTAFTWLFLCLLLLCGLFIGKGYLDGQFHSADTLRAYINRFGFFAPVILIILQALQVILPVLPGFLGCIVGAGLFGAAGGFLCNYIGISSGSIIAFLLAQKLGPSFVKLIVPEEKYLTCRQWILSKKSYTIALFLAILLPLAPDDFLCYFSGLIGMSTKKFVWIILLAKPWCILFYSVLSASLL